MKDLNEDQLITGCILALLLVIGGCVSQNNYYKHQERIALLQLEGTHCGP